MEKSQKPHFSRFLWHGILTPSHFNNNASKVVPWTETTITITRNTLASMIDSAISALKGHLLRLHVPGFPFSVFISSGCFNLLLLANSFLAILAFLVTLIALFSKQARSAWNEVAFSPTATKVKVRAECYAFLKFQKHKYKIMLLEFNRVCFTISSWLLEGINNVKRQLFSETASIHANN